MQKETVETTVSHKITSDLILDLYEQYKELEEGPDKEAFLATLELLSENVGEFLVLTEVISNTN